MTIDNDSFDRGNIVCVFAHDRPGLLDTIRRAVYRLELSIELAKIATSLDQVLDAFYVTDQAGKKIIDEARLESIQFELNNTLAEFDATGHQRLQCVLVVAHAGLIFLRLDLLAENIERAKSRLSSEVLQLAVFSSFIQGHSSVLSSLAPRRMANLPNLAVI